MVRVAFVAGTLGRGGAEQQLYYMVRALRGRGAPVRVLSLTRGEAWERPLRDLGAEVEWVGAAPGKARRLWNTVAALRRDRPDVVQSAHFFTNLYAVGAARWLGLREVGAIRSNTHHELAAHGWLGRPSLRLPRRLAANSRTGLENAAGCGVPRSRLHLLPNFVDTARFRPGAPRGGAPLTLLAAGRLVPVKRFDRFLSVLARVDAPVRALLVGDGPERAALEAQAERLGLGPERLEFRGATADLAPIYREVDALVLTSDREGTPNVVLEAMASGLPVLATRAGGAADLVADGETGFAFDCDDEAGMAARIDALAGDGELRRAVGARARARVEESYSLERLPGRLDALYGEVLR